MRVACIVLIIAGLGIGTLQVGCGSDSGSAGGDAASNPDGTMAGDAAPDAEGPPADAGDAGSTPDGAVDAGNLCGPDDVGHCQDPSLSCLCCPAGGPTNHCLCTTPCARNTDCTTNDRPFCNQQSPDSQGICTAANFPCAWGSVCAAPDTPIATPAGMRPLSSLQVGDLVYSLHERSMQAVPIIRVSRTAVRNHRVRRVQLSNGVVLLISPGHPRADGRSFAGLAAGDSLGELTISSIRDVPYPYAYTYDILPASDTGTYVAGGALIGSTLQMHHIIRASQ